MSHRIEVPEGSPCRCQHVWRLEDVDGAGGEEDDGREGDERLDHHEELGPAGEDRAVSGGERRACVEGNEKIVDEAGAPALFPHFTLGVIVEGHLGEEEGAIGVDAAKLTSSGATRIETPVPGSEDEDVRDPESGCRAEKLSRRLGMGRKGMK